MNLKYFEEHQVTICIVFNDIKLCDIEKWLIDVFGNSPEGWRPAEYTTLVQTFSFNTIDDLLLFKLTWGDYCI